MLFVLLMMSLDKLEPTIVWDLEKQEIFAHWTSFDVNEDDLLAIIDPVEKQLVLIDAADKLVSRCGIPGKGPGEINSPRVVQWLAKEKAFIIYDRGNRRASLWNAEGKLVKEFHLSVNLLASTEFQDTNQFFYVWKPHGQNGKPPTLVKYNVLDKKVTPVWDYQLQGKTFTQVEMTSGTVTLILPWDGYLSFGISDDFIAVTFPDADAIMVIDHGGEILGSFNPNIKRFPVLDDQVEAVIENRPKIMTDALNASRETINKPDFWPSVTGIRIDDQNRIWVTGSEDKRTGFHPLLVFERTGKKVFQAEIQNTPRRLHGNGLYYIHVKEDSTINLEKVTVKVP